MSLTAGVVAALLPDAVPIKHFADLAECYSFPAMVIFDAADWLENEEAQQPGCRLPQGWGVTSDSIAARLAEVLGADELVLLKSMLPRVSRQEVRGERKGRISWMNAFTKPAPFCREFVW